MMKRILGFFFGGGSVLPILIFGAFYAAAAWLVMDEAVLRPLVIAGIIAAAGFSLWGHFKGRRIWVFGPALLAPVLVFAAAYLTDDPTSAQHSALLAGILFALVALLLTRDPYLRVAAVLIAPLAFFGTFEFGQRILNKLTPDPVLGTELVLVEQNVHDTHFGKLTATLFEAPAVERTGIYNFLARFGDTLIWGDGNGRLYAIGPDRSFRQLDIAVEINRDAFLRDAVAIQPGIQINRFSVKDIAVDGNTLYVSHQYWHEDRACYTQRLSAIDINAERLAQNTWDAPRLLFESQPCLAIEAGMHPGQLMEAGGRIGFHQGQILLTLGDNMHDGRIMRDPATRAESRRPIFAQDPDVDYGKVLRIDPATGDASEFTRGHRNPQGLHVARDGTIILTEHGPRGGDELNLLVPGANFGWPYVTYGTDYGAYDWSLNPENGEHAGYEPPIFSWIPAIGISAVTALETGLFSEWRGDIMVTSLTGRRLFRVRIRDDRVVTTEQIDIGWPARDILELDDGTIVISTTGKRILFLEPTGEGPDAVPVAPIADRLEMADLSRGAEIFEENCRACHADDPGEQGAGPNLAGMFRTEPAAGSDYVFSPAFQDRGLVWDAALLDRWIEAPSALVPGTTMIFQGLTDPRDRADLIAHLQSRY